MRFGQTLENSIPNAITTLRHEVSRIQQRSLSPYDVLDNGPVYGFRKDAPRICCEVWRRSVRHIVRTTFMRGLLLLTPLSKNERSCRSFSKQVQGWPHVSHRKFDQVKKKKNTDCVVVSFGFRCLCWVNVF